MENTGFVGGTLVHTDKGLIPIQDIKVGDKVLSIDESQTQKTYQIVQNISKFESKTLLESV